MILSQKNFLNHFFCLLVVAATIFMSVGYASINSITSTIEGDVLAKVQEGVFISMLKE